MQASNSLMGVLSLLSAKLQDLSTSFKIVCAHLCELFDEYGQDTKLCGQSQSISHHYTDSILFLIMCVLLKAIKKKRYMEDQIENPVLLPEDIAEDKQQVR